MVWWTGNCFKIFFLAVFLFLASVSYLWAQPGEVVLADFEKSIPCSEYRDLIGFRRVDKAGAKRVSDGAEGSLGSMSVILSPRKKDLFFQGKVRRMYLATRSPRYDSEGPNTLSFWVKLPKKSSLLGKKNRKTFGVWTYHWRFGDMVVGGKNNNSLATDSMMHGYANFGLAKEAGGKWVRILLSPSAFQISRYHYHFYAAEGTTDDLKFFPSLRQLQFHIGARLAKEEILQLDELKLVYLTPTAVLVEDYFCSTASAKTKKLRVPVSIKNPTSRTRKYRVFISSCIGISRETLQQAFALADDFSITRRMQADAGGDGGVGVAELIDKHGESIIAQGREILVPAGGTWKGSLVYHIRPKMLGSKQHITINGHKCHFRRNTLTTSVIVWDPYEEDVGSMSYVNPLPSNADDGNHPAPPGFPKQKRPPKGWRSEDIPLNQVGGYFVSVIKLTD
jgi:hypothetical protein